MPIAIYVGKSEKEKLRPLGFKFTGDGQCAVGTKRSVAIAEENGRRWCCSPYRWKANRVREAISVEVGCLATAGGGPKSSCRRRGGADSCCLRRSVAAVGVRQDYIQSTLFGIVEIGAAITVEVGSAHL